MRDPPGEEESRVRSRQVLGREQLRLVVEVVADVIERHDDHDETTQKVDRVETRARCGRLGLGVNRERARGGLTQRPPLISNNVMSVGLSLGATA